MFFKMWALGKYNYIYGLHCIAIELCSSRQV